VRQVILGDYVAHCCGLVDAKRPFRVPVARLRAFLSWLAQGMQARDKQPEFHIEFLQPTWLQRTRQIKQWQVLSGLLEGLVSGLVFVLLVVLIFGMGYQLDSGLNEVWNSLGGPVFVLIVWLGCGLILEIAYGLLGRLSKTVALHERLAWLSAPARRHWRACIRSRLGFVLLGFVLLGGLLGGLVGGLTGELLGGLGFVLLGGLLGGLIGVLGVGLDLGLQAEAMQAWTKPNQGIARSIQSALVGGVMGGLVYGPAGRWGCCPCFCQAGWSTGCSALAAAPLSSTTPSASFLPFLARHRCVWRLPSTRPAAGVC
jgi:hypothetical protein